MGRWALALAMAGAIGAGLAAPTLAEPDALLQYLQGNLGGTIGEAYANPNGSGAIELLTSAPVVPQPEGPASAGPVPQTGEDPQLAPVLALSALASGTVGVALVARRRRAA